jgi:hypothetical protein
MPMCEGTCTRDPLLRVAAEDLGDCSDGLNTHARPDSLPCTRINGEKQAVLQRGQRKEGTILGSPKHAIGNLDNVFLIKKGNSKRI